MKPIRDALLVAKVIRSYSNVCGSNTKPATTVFAVERLWYPNTGENSMFASDPSGRQDWMPGWRRPEDLPFVRPGFQPEKCPLITLSITHIFLAV